MKKGNPIALLPIGVFLVLYLGLGLLFEYGLHIPMGFYNIPIVIAFLVSILVACLQNRAVPFEEKLVIMGQGVGDKNIITMLLIFLTAGAFVGVVGRSSAQSVAYFMLDIIPARFAVAVLFVVACFVSTAMGTSVGTITLIMPIASGGRPGVRLRHGAVCRKRRGRCHVRRQPVLHLRHHHCRLQRSRLRHEGQVQGKFLDRPARGHRHAGADPASDHGA